jgi:hypothetical protein
MDSPRDERSSGTAVVFVRAIMGLVPTRLDAGSKGKIRNRDMGMMGNNLLTHFFIVSRVITVNVGF